MTMIDKDHGDSSMECVESPTVELHDKLLSRIRELKRRGRQLGLREEEIRSLFAQSERAFSSRSLRILKVKLYIRRFFPNQMYDKRLGYILAPLAVLLFALILRMSSLENLKEYLYVNYIEDPCLLAMSPIFTDILRHRIPCGICQNLSQVPTVHNISEETFSRKYAYTGVPVLIKDAISDWEALNSFSYQYFKDLYMNSSGSLEFVMDNCMFFGYNTEFQELAEVFEMSDDRAALKEGTKPWYVGWSNCDATHSEVGKILRSQYSRPYFLPHDSNTMDDDWIFMGGPGHGANLHIDYVEKPSWQAQISGKKTWTLEPSPECSSECKTLEVTVEKGDIIVVNTNIWYHKTVVNSGDISITIGAEYD